MGIEQAKIKEWSQKFRKWTYRPDYVVSPEDIPKEYNVQLLDCAFVFQLNDDNNIYMWVTGFDGIGYQTFTMQSTDMINWTFHSLAMSYGKEGCYDFGGVSFGGALLECYNLDAPRMLKKRDGYYWVLYGCYPKQGGYEIRPGAEGIAYSSDGFNWKRLSEDMPILSVDGAEEWEKDCIYEPWLVEHEGMFYDFYNAANGKVEQMGLATSTDLKCWTRYEKNPIVPVGEVGSYNEVFSADGKVFYDEDHWVMIFFGVGKDGAHIMTAYSQDLKKWVTDPQPLYCSGGNPSGLDKNYAHKVSLVKKEGKYYMYYCAVSDKGRGIGLIVSR